MSKVGECKELFEAIRNKDLNRIRELVESRQCVNVKDEYDNTPLHVASSYGYIDVVEFLVKNGAYVNAEDKYGNTPLHLAAWHGHCNVVRYLIKNGVCAYRKNKYGNTPLDLARSRGYFHIVECLKQSMQEQINNLGANGVTADGRTLVDQALEDGDSYFLSELLKKRYGIHENK